MEKTQRVWCARVRVCVYHLCSHTFLLLFLFCFSLYTPCMCVCVFLYGTTQKTHDGERVLTLSVVCVTCGVSKSSPRARVPVTKYIYIYWLLNNVKEWKRKREWERETSFFFFLFFVYLNLCCSFSTLCACMGGIFFSTYTCAFYQRSIKIDFRCARDVILYVYISICKYM